MSKNRNLDERLKVLSPCSESWAEMVGNDKVRFCSHCQKSVHNLSEMTRQEALDLAFKSNGRLCVKYYVNQDQKIKFKETKQLKTSNISPLPSNRSPLLNVAAAGLFALTLGSGISSAQTVIPTVDTSTTQNQTIQNPNLQLEPNSISGTITDETGAVISGAEVVLTGNTIAQKLKTSTNGNGVYYFRSLPAGTYTLVVTTDGFKSLENQGILLQPDQPTKVDCTLGILPSENVAKIELSDVKMEVQVMGMVMCIPASKAKPINLKKNKNKKR